VGGQGAPLLYPPVPDTPYDKCVPVSEADHLRSMLRNYVKELKGVSEGAGERFARAQFGYEPPGAYDVDGLRSVSPSHKSRMRAAAHTRHEMRTQIYRLEREIESLKKRLGVMGVSLATIEDVIRSAWEG
jgi:hypothetical protein